MVTKFNLLFPLLPTDEAGTIGWLCSGVLQKYSSHIWSNCSKYLTDWPFLLALGSHPFYFLVIKLAFTSKYHPMALISLIRVQFTPRKKGQVVSNQRKKCFSLLSQKGTEGLKSPLWRGDTHQGSRPSLTKAWLHKPNS